VPYHTGVAELDTRVSRLAPEWDRPAARAWCEGLEAASRVVPPADVIYRARNLIFRARLDGEEVAVKRFPVGSARSLLYRVRATKAVRAFDHAVRLTELGVGTPRPLAAVDVRRGGRPVASYLCASFVPDFREARTLRSADAPDRAVLMERLGAFVGRLHEFGVLHRDLTSGNILLVPDATRPEGLEFLLVDINRMRFGRVGVLGGIGNLVQLRLNDDGAVLAGYCRERGLDASTLRRLYGCRLALRSLKQDLKERTRPWRRRLGL
jgi:hypothetical protein